MSKKLNWFKKRQWSIGAEQVFTLMLGHTKKLRIPFEGWLDGWNCERPRLQTPRRKIKVGMTVCKREDLISGTLSAAANVRIYFPGRQLQYANG